MARPVAAALLIDLDGVIRIYEPGPARAVEQDYGLADGAILETGLHWPRLKPAITGHQTRAQWRESIALALADRVGGLDRARSMVERWDSYRGEIDPAALSLVREVRAGGRVVALATNATDDLAADLDRLGLAGEFDAVFSSYLLRRHKPSRGYYEACCQALGVPVDQCLLLDDSPRHVDGARAAGLSGYRWSGPGDLPYLRAALGLPASAAG